MIVPQSGSNKTPKGVSLSPFNHSSVPTTTNVHGTHSSTNLRPKTLQISSPIQSSSNNNYLPKIGMSNCSNNINSPTKSSRQREQQPSSRSSLRCSFTPPKKINDRQAPTNGGSSKSRKSFSTGTKSRTETTGTVPTTKTFNIDCKCRSNHSPSNRHVADSSSLPHFNHQQLFEKQQLVTSAKQRRSLSSLTHSTRTSIQQESRPQLGEVEELDSSSTHWTADSHSLLTSLLFKESNQSSSSSVSNHSGSNHDLTVHKELLINPFKDLSNSCKYLPEIPRPKVPDLSDRNQSMFTKLVKIQNFINSFEYNYIDQHFFDITRLRPLKSIISTAKEIINDCLPIRCVEGTFLAIYFTQELEDVERFSVFFETEMTATRAIYRHIVLVVRFKSKYGALGLSRKEDLYYKPLSYGCLSEILREYML